MKVETFKGKMATHVEVSKNGCETESGWIWPYSSIRLGETEVSGWFLAEPNHLSRFPRWLSGKESACSAGDRGDTSLIPGSGRSSGGGHGNPFQYSCQENPMDRGAWWAMVRSVAESQTQLKRLSMHTCSLLSPWKTQTTWRKKQLAIFWVFSPWLWWSF